MPLVTLRSAAAVALRANAVNAGALGTSASFELGGDLGGGLGQ